MTTSREKFVNEWREDKAGNRAVALVRDAIYEVRTVLARGIGRGTGIDSGEHVSRDP